MTSVFCEELAGQSGSRFAQTLGHNGCRNAVLGTTGRFAIIPDLNPLIYGHSLLVTRIYQRALMRHLNDDDIIELESVLRSTSFEFMNVAIFHEMLLCFEHGSSLTSERIICATDHAHLHLLPTSFQIGRKVLTESLAEAKNSGLRQSESIPSDEYIYLGYFDLGDMAFHRLVLLTSELIPSQFMRKVVGRVLGVRNWNWKDTSARRLTLGQIPKCFSFNVSLN